MEQQEMILKLLLDVGETMLLHGSEVKRVEDTLYRMGMAYGAKKMDVFAINSNIVLTMTMGEDKVYTRTRRLVATAETNYWKLEKINELSREYCQGQISLEEAVAMYEIIRRNPFKISKKCIGCAMTAGTLAVFFGGSLLDGAVAFIFGIFVCCFQKIMNALGASKVLYTFMCSLCVGLMTCLCCHVFPLHADKIMIGDIMLLIPGLALTNAIKDVFVGDAISGIMGFAESLIWAGAVACGFMLAIRLMFEPLALADPACYFGSSVQFQYVVQMVTAFLGALGFAILFNVRKKYLLVASLNGMLTWGVYLLSTLFLEDIFVQSAIAAAFAAIFAEIVARIQKAPSSQFMIIGLMPFVPGASLYYMMSSIVLGDVEKSGYYGNRTAAIVLGIAVGITLTWAFYDVIQRLVRRKFSWRQ